MSKPLIGITTERWSSAAGQNDGRVVGALSSYVQAVTGAGGLPILIPLLLPEDDLRAVYARVDGVLMPGGGDIDPQHFQAPRHPATDFVDADRDRVELELVRRAVADRKPLFGICRGVQVLNVALGGTLYQDLPTEYESDLGHYFRAPAYTLDHLAHSVKVEEDTLLARCLGRPLVEVNSRHHQVVKDPAPGLEVVARAPDGVIEAVELPSHPFALGVQWHPENLQARPEMKALFEHFIAAAANGRQP